MVKTEPILMGLCVLLAVSLIVVNATKDVRIVEEEKAEELLSTIAELRLENKELKEINESLNIRVEMLRSQVVNNQDIIRKLTTSNVKEEVRDENVKYLALEMLDKVTLPTTCGVNNPVITNIDYAGLSLKYKEDIYEVDIPTVVSGRNYVLRVTIDRYGEIKHWEWV